MTAPAEHLEQRRVARSLTRPASVTVRALGALGILGGLLLMSVWLPVLSLIPENANLARLALFNAGAIAIGTAILTRAAEARIDGIAPFTAGTAILANAWYLVMLVLSIGRPVYPDPDPEFRQVFLWAGVAMWWTDAALGMALLRWRSFGRWGALALAIGSVGAFSGMGHLRLFEGDLGWFFLPASQVGIALNGLGWIVLGLAVAMSRRPVEAPAKVPEGS
ncbi:MAG: hypothetical protein L0227_08320 [Chloroflexi bacterium]|nr:hypothetical protein [Chloroflexota bacterium]